MEAFASGSRPSHASPSSAPSGRAAARASGLSRDGGGRRAPRGAEAAPGAGCGRTPASGSPSAGAVAAPVAGAVCFLGLDVIDRLRLVLVLVVRGVVHELVVDVDLFLLDDVRVVVPL